MTTFYHDITRFELFIGSLSFAFFILILGISRKERNLRYWEFSSLELVFVIIIWRTLCDIISERTYQGGTMEEIIQRHHSAYILAYIITFTILIVFETFLIIREKISRYSWRDVFINKKEPDKQKSDRDSKDLVPLLVLLVFLVLLNL